MEPITEQPVTAQNFDFDFSVLADFCKTRNRGRADSNGNTPPPRVQFLLDLIAKVGLTAELDVWVGNRFQRGTDLEHIINFSAGEIDTVVDGMDHLTTEQKIEEKRVLRIAFAEFYKPINELRTKFDELDRRQPKSAEARIYKMMVKFKSDIANSVDNNFYNIYIKGTGNCAIMAHHDIVNPGSDNCNDNSASCINVIAAKLLNPSVHVIINDAEEIGGLGAERSAHKIVDGHFGELDFVLNLELTAVGGKNFFIEKYSKSKLFERVLDLFPGVDLYSTPFHDGMVLRRFGIDSLVINPLPRLGNGELKYELLHLCHSYDDRISLANYGDMRDFVVDVVTPIIDGRASDANHRETNAPLDTVLCQADGLFNDNSIIVKLVEIDGAKKLEVQTVKSVGHVLNKTEHYDLKMFKYVYNEWKREKRFGMKAVVDIFNDYIYI